MEIRYSTARTVKKLSEVKRTILFIELSILLMVLLVLNFNYAIAKRRINFIVDSIKNWRNGGLKNFELDTTKDEFKIIEKSVSEMYFEILKEKKIDEVLLSLTSKILFLITKVSNLRDFCKELEETLKTELKLSYVKILRDGKLVKVNAWQIALKLKNNPEIKIIIEGNIFFSEEILCIFENLIDAALLTVKEKSAKESLFELCCNIRGILIREIAIITIANTSSIRLKPSLFIHAPFIRVYIDKKREFLNYSFLNVDKTSISVAFLAG